jgi:thymidylate synthase (FAD)
MYIEVSKVAPLLFAVVGPACLIKGKCEEANPCGKPYAVLEQL